MITFKDWKIDCKDHFLAQQFDNLSRELRVEGDFPVGYQWEALIRVELYMDIIPLKSGTNCLYATLTEDQLSLAGHYEVQLQGTLGSVVKHTNVVRVYVEPSLSGEEQWPEVPATFRKYEARLNAAADRADAAADKAKDIADATASKVGEAAAHAKTAGDKADLSVAAARDAARSESEAWDYKEHALISVVNARIYAEGGEVHSYPGEPVSFVEVPGAKGYMEEARAAVAAAESAKDAAEVAAQEAVDEAFDALKHSQDAQTGAINARAFAEGGELHPYNGEHQALYPMVTGAKEYMEQAAAAKADAETAKSAAETAKSVAEAARVAAQAAAEAAAEHDNAAALGADRARTASYTAGASANAAGDAKIAAESAKDAAEAAAEAAAQSAEEAKNAADGMSGDFISWDDLFCTEPVEVEVLAETTLTESDYSSTEVAYVLESVDLAIETGKTYIVNWNGVQYNSFVHDAGNEVLILTNEGTNTDTGEGAVFAIQTEGQDAYVIPLDGSTSVTLSIYTEDEMVTTIDPKYLPADLGAGSGGSGEAGVGIESVEQTTTSSSDGGSNVITVTLTNGTKSTFTVRNGSKGSKGDKGDTPQKYVDYWTEEDRQLMIGEILAALPKAEEATF